MFLTEKALLPGMVVEAELKKTVRRALILAGPDGMENQNPAVCGLRTKAIKSVVAGGPAVSAPLLDLLKWMAGYYMVPEGLVLKVMFGGGLFEKGKPAPDRGAEKSTAEAAPCIDEGMEPGLGRLRRAQGYRAFLLHAPDGSFETRFVLEAVKGKDLRGIIVLCPERSRVMEYQALMRPVFGRRLCVLHGGLSPAKRRSVYDRILSGEADVVLGTRLAVFAPLKKVSFIALTGEEDLKNYKNRQDVRYGAREVAVMRAYFEGARILLSSICPSAESYLNALRGKYEYLRCGLKPAAKIKTRIKILSGLGKKGGLSIGGDGPSAGAKAKILDGAVAEALVRALERGGSALLVADRQGHSVPLCEDCGHFERCPACGTALVLHKGARGVCERRGECNTSLICHHCGYGKAAPEACPLCGGLSLKLLGAGIERLREEAEGFLKKPGRDAGIRVLDRGKKKGPDHDTGPEDRSAAIYIGTKRIARARGVLGAAKPQVAILVYPETAFFRPDFRARERAFSELVHLADAVAADGQIIIQTRTPELFRAMRGLDYEEFMRAELEERKALGYPPFQRLGRITVVPAKAAGGKAHGAGTGGIQGWHFPEGVSVLGPAEGMDERGRRNISFQVKAPAARALKEAVEKVLESLPLGKVTVDIDPV